MRRAADRGDLRGQLVDLRVRSRCSVRVRCSARTCETLHGITLTTEYGDQRPPAIPIGARTSAAHRQEPADPIAAITTSSRRLEHVARPARASRAVRTRSRPAPTTTNPVARPASRGPAATARATTHTSAASSSGHAAAGAAKRPIVPNTWLQCSRATGVQRVARRDERAARGERTGSRTTSPAEARSPPTTSQRIDGIARHAQIDVQTEERPDLGPARARRARRARTPSAVGREGGSRSRRGTSATIIGSDCALRM